MTPDPTEQVQVVTARELDARMDEIRRAVDLANAKSGDKVELRDYLEALRTGDQRALDMAADERAKAAEVLRDEQRRALTVAQEEREKAAQALSGGTDRAIADNFARLSDRFDAYEQHIKDIFDEKERANERATDEREKAALALRDGLDRAIREGDERLGEHVRSQFDRVAADLRSADKLELARIEAVRNEVLATVHANRELFREIQTAAKEAVGKAETAQQNINEGQNEFRKSLNDLTGTMMPRRESESLFGEQARQIAENREAVAALRTQVAVGPAGLNTLQSRFDTSDGQQSGRTTAAALTLERIVAIVAVLTLIAYILTRVH